MVGVTLNMDLGELPDEPEALYACCTVANVACGGHVGDAASMSDAVGRCVRYRCRLSAHPSYPDRASFGRVSMTLPQDVLVRALVTQLEALQATATAQGTTVTAVKPHGALYHDAASTSATAQALLDAVDRVLPAVTLVGPPVGGLARLCAARGLGYAREGFADRAYRADGGLLARGQPGALLLDPAACAAQAVRLAQGGQVETVCVHGDTPNALAVVTAVRDALANAGLLVTR